MRPRRLQQNPVLKDIAMSIHSHERDLPKQPSLTEIRLRKKSSTILALKIYFSRFLLHIFGCQYILITNWFNKMTLCVVVNCKKDVKLVCLWHCFLLTVPQTIRKAGPYLKYGPIRFFQFIIIFSPKTWKTILSLKVFD